MKPTPTPVRETERFRAEISARGIRLTCKLRGHFPRSRVIPARDRGYIESLGLRPDANGITEFDASVVWDYGLGVRATR
jgi:hypothetical protein